MQHLSAIFLIVVLFVLGVYFLKTGGNLSLESITSSTQTGGLGVPKMEGSFNMPGGEVSRNNGGSIEGQTSTPSKRSSTAVGKIINTPSPGDLKGISDIDGVTHLSSNFKRIQFGTFNPQSQISLKAAFSGAPGVNITGWEIRGRNGGIFVPQAVNIYYPMGVAEPSDIILRPGEVLNMYTKGSSALGVNFRPNKCMGYLANSLSFSPSISRNCPGGDRTAVQNFSAECQDYVGSLGSCKEPSPNPSTIPYWDIACREYLKQFNYAGCFRNYLGSPDFLSKEWRAWVGPISINPRHDRVFLLDEDGLIVDFKSY